ncbi:MAG: cytochrome c1 [Epsilonproteobacteria bacterium]|nr:cytochrome c1 [Campylobacterota bacterium]
MNKELKILAVVVFFSVLTYIGVEPFAHSQMHAHVESHNFVYDGTADVEEVEHKIEKAKEEKHDTAALEKKLEEKKAFWADVKKISALKGDATAGEATFAMCAGCHNGSGMNMGGVVPPDLDHAGSLYDKNYLIALIKNPAMASNVDHKYADTAMHPMGSISSMVSADQDIANVVAYIKEKKAGEVTNKEAYVEACGRCHANRYGKWTLKGFVPKTKSDITTGVDLEGMKFQEEVAKEKLAVAKYMGKLPPDLSIIIRSRGEHFLKTFIEDPQSQLPGTAMPRTGLSEEGYEKVMGYLARTGDAKKPNRDELGWKVILYFVIFTVLAYLWKKQVWSKLH